MTRFIEVANLKAAGVQHLGFYHRHNGGLSITDPVQEWTMENYQEVPMEYGVGIVYLTRGDYAVGWFRALNYRCHFKTFMRQEMKRSVNDPHSPAMLNAINNYLSESKRVQIWFKHVANPSSVIPVINSKFEAYPHG